MTADDPHGMRGLVVEEEIHFTLVELCRSCRVPEPELRAWVAEGLLQPTGDQPEDWRFSGSSLRRVRTALRLSRDLEINLAGIAVALDLLDEIALLRSRLQGDLARDDDGALLLVE
jgi:chaperone modulatory protein CbpM